MFWWFIGGLLFLTALIGVFIWLVRKAIEASN